jgi:16S rRNA pseudouridine516 synthase
LLLLTDDGDLAHRLLSPKFHVDKTYYARVEGKLTAEDVTAFAQGITLADGFECRPAKLTILSDQEALVTVQEGKFHQVKRMLASRGKPVIYLRRDSMGPLSMDETPIGAYRFLTEAEETALRGL